MLRKIVIAAITATALVALQDHASAGGPPGMNGQSVNGIEPNALTANALTANALTANALTANAIDPNGLSADATLALLERGGRQDATVTTIVLPLAGTFDAR
jgi:hypothetical protein